MFYSSRSPHCLFFLSHHAPLGVRSTKHRHQSPEWTMLSHVNCFIQGEVIEFQVLLDGLHPHSTFSKGKAHTGQLKLKVNAHLKTASSAIMPSHESADALDFQTCLNFWCCESFMIISGTVQESWRWQTDRHYWKQYHSLLYHHHVGVNQHCSNQTVSSSTTEKQRINVSYHLLCAECRRPV